MRGAVCILALCLSLPASPGAISENEWAVIQKELSAPIVLKLSNGQRIVGNPIHVSDKQIQIASAEGAGEIVFTFELAQVSELSLQGESYKTLALEWMEAGEAEAALELMAMLFAQRSPLLPLLPAGESHFFIYYVDLVLASPHPARAIAITEALRPQIENPAALRALDDAILKSYQSLELYDQAIPLAETWVAERQPYGGSALGYYVLGAARLRAGAYEEALDLALRPIVFSSPLSMDQMDACYAVAVSAALALRERDYAAMLYREMKSRGLVWPAEDSTLEVFLKQIEEYIEDHEDDETTP